MNEDSSLPRAMATNSHCCSCCQREDAGVLRGQILDVAVAITDWAAEGLSEEKLALQEKARKYLSKVLDQELLPKGF